ncbi:MAG: phosphatidate cytidylyltransferase, partial [Woeseia sp.]|nr:phosphatidate cytidylyltransferase [Woeseia sp.]
MLKQRLISAVIAVIVLGVVLFVLPLSAARVFIAGVILVAAWEWGGFFGGTGNAWRVACVAVIAILQLLLLFALESGWLAEILVFVIGLLWWAAAFCWLQFYPTPVPRALTWLAAILVLLPAWLAVDYILRASSALLLFVLIIVWAADIGAYFAGKRFGRVKLAPRVSPGKTWEGVFGGLILVALISFVGARLLELTLVTLLPFSIGIALLSVVGDLTV